jgi:hypothetical protein
MESGRWLSAEVRRGRCGQAGDWPVALGNQHILAAGDASEQLRQRGLGFLPADDDYWILASVEMLPLPM